jgi:hypothetical protein
LAFYQPVKAIGEMPFSQCDPGPVSGDSLAVMDDVGSYPLQLHPKHVSRGQADFCV